MDSDNLSSNSDNSQDANMGQARDDALDDALEAALAQNDYITISRLAFEQSLRFQHLERYFLAVEYSGIALDAWSAHFDGASDEALTVARSTELRMVNAAAVHNFNHGDYSATIDLIQQARRLAALMPPTVLTASTEWTTALLERWRRNFPKALQHALRAWATYRANGASPLNIARVRLFIAQIAQDCAAAVSRDASQLVDRYLRLAWNHLDSAQPPADLPHSSAVEGNYRLIYAVHSRLTGRNEDRTGMLESVVLLSQALNDPILEGQTYTVLGDEFSFQGRMGEARTCYRIAYETLASSQAPSLAVWPLRPLKQEWEYNLDPIADALR